MKLLTASIITTVTMMVLLLAGIQTAKAQSSNWTIPSYTDTLQIPYPIDKDLIADGHKIYNSNCQTCHGNKAKGKGPAAVALNPKPANLTQKVVQNQKLGNLYYRVSNGHLDMPAWKSSLSSKQIWSVVVYIKSLTNKDLLANK